MNSFSTATLSISERIDEKHISHYKHKDHIDFHNDEQKATEVNDRKIVRIKKQKSLTLPISIFPEFHDKGYHESDLKRYLPEYSITEIEKHNTEESCWIIVKDLVLDVTNFVTYHPGGKQSILKYAGQDCTEHYRHHSKIAKKLFRKFAIGRIPQKHEANSCIIL